MNKKTTIQAHENNELSADHVLEKVDNDLKEVKRAKSVKSKVKKMFSGLKKSKADISRVSFIFAINQKCLLIAVEVAGFFVLIVILQVVVMFVLKI